MNSLTLISSLLLLTSMVVAQSSYAPAEYTPWREERQTEVVEEGESWLSSLISGDWWTWDRDVVKNGIWKNDNIMIHVGQNLFNFVFSTLAWFTVSQIYSLTAGVNTPRSMRALSISEAADQVLDAFQKFENRN